MISLQSPATDKMHLFADAWVSHAERNSRGRPKSKSLLEWRGFLSISQILISSSEHISAEFIRALLHLVQTNFHLSQHDLGLWTEEAWEYKIDLL